MPPVFWKTTTQNNESTQKVCVTMHYLLFFHQRFYFLTLTQVVLLGFHPYVNLRWNTAWTLPRRSCTSPLWALQHHSAKVPPNDSTKLHISKDTTASHNGRQPCNRHTDSVIKHHIITSEQLFYAKYYLWFGRRVDLGSNQFALCQMSPPANGTMFHHQCWKIMLLKKSLLNQLGCISFVLLFDFLESQKKEGHVLVKSSVP